MVKLCAVCTLRSHGSDIDTNIAVAAVRRVLSVSVTRMMTLARTEGEGPTTGQFRSIFTSSKETGECYTGLARLDLKFDVFRR